MPERADDAPEDDTHIDSPSAEQPQRFYDQFVEIFRDTVSAEYQFRPPQPKLGGDDGTAGYAGEFVDPAQQTGFVDTLQGTDVKQCGPEAATGQSESQHFLSPWPKAAQE